MSMNIFTKTHEIFKKMSYRKFIILVMLYLFLCVLLVIVALVIHHLRFNTTPSFPRGVYQIQPASDKPTRGDLVTFCLESNNPFSHLAKARQYVGYGTCPSGLKPLLKQVFGLPGDLVEITEAGIILNGRKIHTSARPNSDSQGRSLPPSMLIGGLSPEVIPEGQALVLSQTHGGSFDSRHFGLISMESLMKVEPILILEEAN